MKKSIIIALLAAGALLGISPGCSPQYDIVITGGQILDGSDADAFFGDIAIKDGRITAIGNIKFSAPTIIDATGLYIAPGFIDLHTHCDRQLADNDRKAALNYLTQGVTTVVTGNCGSGRYDVKDYFNQLSEQGIGLNTVHLVGHGTVRDQVMGSANRPPTPEELTQMKALIAQAMNQGAAGMSTGLFYDPGSFAQTEEVIELARVVADHHGIYATHIRDESNYSIGLPASIREAIEIAETANLPLQISHLKALGPPAWNQAPEICQIIEDAQARGVKIRADQYPYTASSTSLTAAVIPRWVQTDRKTIQRLRDPELLPRIKIEIAENIARRGGADTLVLSSCRSHPEWIGKSLAYISRELQKLPTDTAIEIVLTGGAKLISHNQTDADVEYFMQKPYVMTGSDGNLVEFGSGAPHPRSYGAFPRKISLYALEKQLITLPQAIRSCTSLPAEILDFKDRGLVKKGYVADLVVFNPSTLRDRATFENPHQYSEGVEFILVNGVITIEKGNYNGALAGQPITPNHD